MVVDVRVSERAGKLMRRDARSEPKKKDTIRLEMEVAPHRKMLKTVLPVYTVRNVYTAYIAYIQSIPKLKKKTKCIREEIH